MMTSAPVSHPVLVLSTVWALGSDTGCAAWVLAPAAGVVTDGAAVA